MDRTHSADTTTGPCDQDCLPDEACSVEDGHYSDGTAQYLLDRKEGENDKQDGELDRKHMLLPREGHMAY